MAATALDIVDLQMWAAAKRRYQNTEAAKHTPWKSLSPRQRHMFYTSERLRGRFQ